MRKKSKLKLLVTGLILLVVGLLVPGNICFARTEIDFYCLAWQPVILERAENLVAEYNKQNPSVKVNYIHGDWGNARDYIITSLAGGEAPDVVHGITPWALEFGTMGYLEDLRKYIPKSMWEDIDERAWYTMEHPYYEEIYAIPWCWETQVIIYNAERFAKLGIKLPPRGESMTWEEFTELCQKVTEPGKYYAFATSFTVAQSAENIISFIWQKGEDIMHPDREGKWVVTFGSKAKEAISWYRDLIHKYKVMPKDIFGLEAQDIFDGFNAGSYSMFITGCWARSENFAQKAPFEWGVMPLPHPKDGQRANLTEPQVFFIPKDSPHKKEAWEFLSYMVSTNNMAALAAGDWLFPTRKSSLALAPFNSREYYWDVCLSALKYGRPYVPHPAWGEFTDRVLGPTLQAMLMKKIDIDRGVEKIIKEGNRILERFRKRR